MGKETFETKFKDYQARLIREEKVFEGAKGNRKLKSYGQLKAYKYILEEGKEDKNLFADIREKVKT